MRQLIVATMALTLVTSVGCRKKANYVDPDAQSRVEGTGIESRDVRVVVGQMSGELLASLVFAEETPRIAVLPIENQSRFYIDQEIFTTLITDELINNAGGKMAIVNRDLIEQILEERERKASGQVSDDGSLQALAGVDHFLEGEVRSLSASTNKAQTDYVVIRFQLTDAETGIIRWSNAYEMKKEGSWGVIYQ